MDANIHLDGRYSEGDGFHFNQRCVSDEEVAQNVRGTTVRHAGPVRSMACPSHEAVRSILANWMISKQEKVFHM